MSTVQVQAQALGLVSEVVSADMLAAHCEQFVRHALTEDVAARKAWAERRRRPAAPACVCSTPPPKRRRTSREARGAWLRAAGDSGAAAVAVSVARPGALMAPVWRLLRRLASESLGCPAAAREPFQARE